MLPPPLSVSPEMARRFHRRALLLDAPAPNIAAVLDHHGYIQIDPLNVCGRMQDHFLRNRVLGYAEGGLMRHVHGGDKPLAAERRQALEHHLPDSHVLVAFTLDAWPHLLAAMRRRTRRASPWSGRLTPREADFSERLLAEIAERGPLSSEHIDDDRRSRQWGWGASSLAKTTLQKLFFHGRLLIARRDANRRLYDLPEKVLPKRILALKEPDAAATARWVALLKLRQRRLAPLKREELALVEDRVQPVAVAGCPMLYCLREDVALFAELEAEAAGGSLAAARPLLLAPLDPLIYDRRLTQRLWNFDYTWEVYTPAAKRKRGYYALPVLAGAELVGHVEPKADRLAKRLRVVSKQIRRGHKTAAATMIYARLDQDPVRASVEKATDAMLRAAGVKNERPRPKARQRGPTVRRAARNLGRQHTTG